jgi:hypothetical protein
VTAPFRSLAQIRNRLTLSARCIVRDHRPEPDGRCPVCRVPDCPAVAAALAWLAAVPRGGEARRADGAPAPE